jgi:hypothetical protein
VYARGVAVIRLLDWPPTVTWAVMVAAFAVAARCVYLFLLLLKGD